MATCVLSVTSVPVLHTYGMLNNTVSQNNILIKDGGQACITDTGLDALMEKHLHPGRVPAPSRWFFKAPEELEAGVRGMPQDVYAFASTAYIVSHGLQTSRQADSMSSRR